MADINDIYEAHEIELEAKDMQIARLKKILTAKDKAIEEMIKHQKEYIKDFWSLRKVEYIRTMIYFSINTLKDLKKLGETK